MRCLIVVMLLFSLVECSITDPLGQLLLQAKGDSCRYTRYGVDRGHCKQYMDSSLTPIYPGLSYNPFTPEGFGLPIYEPIDTKSSRMFALRNVSIIDACTFNGYNAIYRGYVIGNNLFSSFMLSDYKKFYSPFIDIKHDCKMSTEIYSLTCTYGSPRKFSRHFTEALRLLPIEYNQTIYSQFFGAYPPLVAFGSYGGSITTIRATSENFGVQRSSESVIFSGGNSTIVDKYKWVDSILSNMTMVDFDTMRMSDLIKGMVHPQVIGHIKEEEYRLILGQPNSTHFEQLRQSERPCRLVNITDMAIATKEYSYRCPGQDHDFYGYFRKNSYGDTDKNAGCSEFSKPDCGPGTLVFGEKCSSMKSFATSSLHDGHNDIFDTMLINQQNDYWVNMYTLIVFSPITRTKRLDDPMPDKNFPIGYCSSVRHTGMVLVNRFKCTGAPFGYLVLPQERHPYCIKEQELCYAYPYGILSTHETLGKTRSVCVEVRDGDE